MIDFRIQDRFVLKQLKEGRLASATGVLINAGELYIEHESGDIYSLHDTSPIDFFGDLIYEEDDYASVEGIDLDIQDIYIRVFTETTDFAPYPELGADISDLKGMFNEESTAQLGVDKLIYAMTRDGRFTMSDVSVDVVPLSSEQLLFYITLHTDDGDVNIPVPFEL